LITDVQLGHQIIKTLKHVIKARTDYLGARGYKAWAPGCGLSFLVLQIEEASIFLEDLDPDEIKAVAKAARSAGLALKLSLQRPSHDELDTTARSQFGGVACYDGLRRPRVPAARRGRNLRGTPSPVPRPTTQLPDPARSLHQHRHSLHPATHLRAPGNRDGLGCRSLRLADGPH